MWRNDLQTSFVAMRSALTTGASASLREKGLPPGWDLLLREQVPPAPARGRCGELTSPACRGTTGA